MPVVPQACGGHEAVADGQLQRGHRHLPPAALGGRGVEQGRADRRVEEDGGHDRVTGAEDLVLQEGVGEGKRESAWRERAARERCNALAVLVHISGRLFKAP